MRPHDHESGLSEVIGFLLIISLLATLFSMYLVYVVPAQGREAEILHMDYIRDQFIDYKTVVDSLIINEKIGVPIVRVINPGAAGGKTTGSFSILPMSGSVGSSGTVSVNRWPEGPTESVTISVDGIWTETAGKDPMNQVDIIIEKQNSPLFLQINTTDITQGGTINVSSSTDWKAVFSIKNNTIVKNFTSDGTEYHYDLMLSVIKDQDADYTFEDLLIRKDIANNTDYLINLLDESYGLNFGISYPFKINAPETTSPRSAMLTWYGYNFGSGQTKENTHTLGYLRYISNNYYWIQQSYFYQFGGVFVSQNEGMTPKIFPSISLSEGLNKVLDVSIYDLNILNTTNNNVVGTGPVQIVTSVKYIDHNTFNGVTLSNIKPNARKIEISVLAKDNYTATMWKNTFKRLVETHPFKPEWVSIPDTFNNVSKIIINGQYSNDTPDIYLDYTKTDLNIDLMPIKEA